METKKKYIIVTSSLGSGGLSKISTNTANILAKKGHDVLIICLLEADAIHFPLDKNVRVEYLNVKNNKFSKITKINFWKSHLKEIFIREKPDSVLAMTLKISALCALAKKNMTFRLTLREISDPRHKGRSRLIDSCLFRICKNKVDALIFQTEWEKSCYPKYLQKKGYVVPNPVTVDLSKSDNRKKEVVTVAQLYNKSKRHDILLKAFSIFVKKNKDFILNIYGSGPDLRKNINICKKLGITDKVVFQGSKKNVLAYIRDASCFVQTSVYEGMSNALVEALLLGVPCITTNWNGASEIIKDGYNGFVVEKNNPEAIARAMDILVNDRSLMDKFSNNGVLEKEKYNFENTYLKYIDILDGNM